MFVEFFVLKIFVSVVLAVDFVVVVGLDDRMIN
mgnify:CR=1 FL=1